jgi:hypothetical protein
MSESSSVVGRQSPYRNVYAAPTFTSLNIYENCKLGTSKNVSSELKCNSKMLAFPSTTSGSLLVASIPTTSTYKCVKLPEVPYSIAGHSGALTDFEFYPFENDDDKQMIATGSMDGLIKLWKIPNDTTLLSGNMTEASVVLNDSTPANRIMFHTMISNLMYTSHQNKSIAMWDIVNQKKMFSVDPNVHKGLIESMSISGDGSLVASGSCDKTLRIFDPRASTNAQSSVQAHNSTKGFQVVWLGSQPFLLTSGFSTGKREVSVFDTRAMKEAIKTVYIDNGSLPVYPFYVPQNGVVFLCGKGDRNVRCMELEFTANGSCDIHALNDFSATDAQRALYPMPRSTVDVTRCEISRFLKLTPQNTIQSVSMIVPRKNLELFHEDLYPLESVIEPCANVTDWFQNSTSVLTPKLVDRKPDNMESIYNVPVEQGGRLRPGTIVPDNDGSDSDSEYSDCEWISGDEKENSTPKKETKKSEPVQPQHEPEEVQVQTRSRQRSKAIVTKQPPSESTTTTTTTTTGARARNRTRATLTGAIQQMAQQYTQEFKQTAKFSSYLQKKNPRGLIWKKRWFSLEDGAIYYFEDQSSSKSLGKISLDDIQDVVTQEKKVKFTISTKGREYVLKADSEQMCIEWISMIKKALFRSGKKQSISRASVSGRMEHLVLEQQFDLCGELKKLGVTGGWRKRYFDYSPDDHTLSYRVKKKSKSSLGSIHLDRVISIETVVSGKISKRNHNLCFQIVTQSRNFILQAPNDAMFKLWTKTLQTEVQFIQTMQEREEELVEQQQQLNEEDLDNQLRGHLLIKTQDGLLKKRWLYADEKTTTLFIFTSHTAEEQYVKENKLDKEHMDLAIQIQQIEQVEEVSATEAKELEISNEDVGSCFTIKVNTSPKLVFLCYNPQLKKSWIDGLMILKDVYGGGNTSVTDSTNTTIETTETTTNRTEERSINDQVSSTTNNESKKQKKSSVADLLDITNPDQKSSKELATNDLSCIKNGTEQCLIMIKSQLVAQVEQTAKSLNRYNVYILDCGSSVYQWNGRHAHRLDKAKGLEIATNIKFKERGGACQIKVIDDTDTPEQDEEMHKFHIEFWKYLGGTENDSQVQKEDKEFVPFMKIYRISKSNDIRKMITIVPHDNRGNSRPSKDILNSKNAYVVDTGSELYVWVGKRSTSNQRALGLLVAEKIIQTQTDNHIPSWVRVTRLIENAETTLWKSKFENYPGMLPIHTGTIETRGNIAEKQEQQKIDVNQLLDRDITANHKDDFIISDRTLFATQQVQIWRIQDFDKQVYPESMHGQFFTEDTFIILFTWTEIQKPMPQYILYFWQGQEASANMKGTSALLSVNIDDQLDGQATQVRVEQGKEPEFFLKLFASKYIVHKGSYTSTRTGTRLYDIRGVSDWNMRAVELEGDYHRLNSMHSFVLSTFDGKVYIWNGTLSNSSERTCAQSIANIIKPNVKPKEIQENNEDLEFQSYFNTPRKPYLKLSQVENSSNRHAPRVFICTQATGIFSVEEMAICIQEDFHQENCYIVLPYSEQQTLFVWIGKNSSDFVKRWTLNTATDMLPLLKQQECITTGLAVYGGKEPTQFYYCIQGWNDSRAAAARKRRSSIASNIDVNNELTPLEKLVKIYCVEGVTYSYQELLRNILPNGVDPNKLETYLSEEEFLNVFDMPRSDFLKYPQWKQLNLKKKVYLY